MASERDSSPGAASILLVEDEPSLVLTLSDRLISEGFRVETATDGQIGFERAIGARST